MRSFRAPLRFAVLVLAAGAGLLVPACGRSEAGSAPAAPPAPEVSVETVRPAALPVIDELPGRVVAFRVAEVRPQVGGIVHRKLFEDGDEVRAGQPLYQIEAAPFRANLQGSQALLARGRAAVAQAETQAERAHRLRESGAISEQAVDDADAALALARAELAQASASVARSRLDLRFATITAPIDGRIGISRITEGALVGPADPEPLVTIQQIDRVYVDARQPAARFDELRSATANGAIRGGETTPVTVILPNGGAYDERGRLLFSDITVDPGTGEVTLRALVPNPTGRLLPGMFVRARIERGEDPDAITVPEQAVQRDAAGAPQVLVVGEDRKVAVRSVETGPVVAGRTVVESGLRPGDRVVVEGHDHLRPGLVVKPVAWEPPSTTASR